MNALDIANRSTLILTVSISSAALKHLDTILLARMADAGVKISKRQTGPEY